MNIVFRFLGFLIGVYALAGCAAVGPVSSMSDRLVSPLIDWPAVATQRDENCYNLFSKYDKWGVFVGCQSISIFDVRTDHVFDLFSENLAEQSCITPLTNEGKRNYIRTGDHFLFIDKVTKNANAWFVPAGYYSDGVSTPNIVREILPGAILDTESPRTLSAALFHDRYFCLFEYSRIAWNPERENYPDRLSQLANQGSLPIEAPTTYRRRGCTNISFRDGLRTAGASSIVSTVFFRIVGFVNPGGTGYCPQLVHAPALAALDQRLEDMLDVGPIGSSKRAEIPGCRAKEPMVLCLSNVEALWFLVTLRPDDYDETKSTLITDEWRQVLTRIMCYEIQARIVGSDWSNIYSFDRRQAQETCSSVVLDELATENDDIRDQMAEIYETFRDPAEPIESPFRAGDFLVEAALMLTRKNGPETFLQTVASAKTIDFAILSVVIWNEEFKTNPDYQRIKELTK